MPVRIESISALLSFHTRAAGRDRSPCWLLIKSTLSCIRQALGRWALACSPPHLQTALFSTRPSPRWDDSQNGVEVGVPHTQGGNTGWGMRWPWS